ncbi:hypothetical protein PV755_00880 [Streptomyces caniscabiei]|uniref:hypothetical protein n=1 Tax=Streptomyces caniscabiei TaxID=2746961 RepID=UPI0029A91B65|nr:hypothetical protein [Streptomyces caniscabiei]MDX3507489.1 hypothetical protein [Streptomyces caniscabiei]
MPTVALSTESVCTMQHAGQDWDAIRALKSVGLAAMAILGSRCGAVVEEASGTAVVFFTPCGAAADWSVDHTQALEEGAAVAIPPARRTQGPGPRWRMCPGEGRMLTDAQALKAALEDAFGPRVGEERAG